MFLNPLIITLFVAIAGNKIFAKDSEIVIRSAIADEITEILELDKEISFEYFKPLYQKAYSHLAIGQNPDYYLDLELKLDKEMFYECIHNLSSKQLYIAYDCTKGAIVGFIVFHKEDEDILELDLLLVHKKYRRMNIGKQLIKKALDTFSAIKQCIVYPLRFANNEALKFYQALGFKNLGIAPSNKKNVYGLSYSDMYFLFKLELIHIS